MKKSLVEYFDEREMLKEQVKTLSSQLEECQTSAEQSSKSSRKKRLASKFSKANKSKKSKEKTES
jgi:hypothetical protein